MGRAPQGVFALLPSGAIAAAIRGGPGNWCVRKAAQGEP